jgi:hypothetical protein
MENIDQYSFSDLLTRDDLLLKRYDLGEIKKSSDRKARKHQWEQAIFSTLYSTRKYSFHGKGGLDVLEIMDRACYSRFLIALGSVKENTYSYLRKQTHYAFMFRYRDCAIQSWFRGNISQHP